MSVPGEAADERFEKSDRILNRSGFRRVYENGRKYQAKYFTAFVLLNSEQHARLGITATRKVGKAIYRNKARRLVREVFRKNKWRIRPGIDIVINVKSNLAAAGYYDLEGDFIRFLENAK